MITLLTGENSFEIQQMVNKMIAEFNGTPEKVDASEMTVADLPNLLTGMTLFAEKRLIIIKFLSDNKPVWEALPDWLKKVDSDLQVVLIDEKPDKRTRTYKELKKYATVKEFPVWSDRDTDKAISWVMEEASQQRLELNKKSAQLLVMRVGLDQWQLLHAIEKLVVMGKVDTEIIETVIDSNPKENVFELFEAALSSDAPRVNTMLATLELTEDPYMVFGLLSGQAFQLASLATSTKPPAEVARDFGAHPFVMTKLSRYATKLEHPGVKQIISAFAEGDKTLKTTGVEPWIIIQRTLMKICTRQATQT